MNRMDHSKVTNNTKTFFRQPLHRRKKQKNWHFYFQNFQQPASTGLLWVSNNDRLDNHGSGEGFSFEPQASASCDHSIPKG